MHSVAVRKSTNSGSCWLRGGRLDARLNRGNRACWRNTLVFGEMGTRFRLEAQVPKAYTWDSGATPRSRAFRRLSIRIRKRWQMPGEPITKQSLKFLFFEDG